MNNSLTPLENIRFTKLQSLVSAGIICYPERYDRMEIQDVKKKVDSLTPISLTSIDETNSFSDLAIAGRIIARRSHGRVTFLDIQ